jgi:UDP-N-acetylenolpyruvoylglucosamine reductase
MNNGQCDYNNLLELINLAQEKVKNKFNIELINEVRIITNK